MGPPEAYRQSVTPQAFPLAYFVDRLQTAAGFPAAVFASI